MSAFVVVVVVVVVMIGRCGLGREKPLAVLTNTTRTLPPNQTTIKTTIVSLLVVAAAG